MMKVRNTRRTRTRKGRADQKSLPMSASDDGMTWATQTEGFPRVPIPSGNHVVQFVKSFDLGTVLTTSNAASSFGSINFQLNQVLDYSSYTAIFDQYRVDDLELWIIPAEDTATDYINYGKSMWVSVIDYDDSTNLTSVGSALDYDNAVVSALNCSQLRHFKPRIAVAAYSGTFTSYKNDAAGWLDCASPSIQHYGVKMACDLVNLPVPLNFRAFGRVKLSFRGTR